MLGFRWPHSVLSRLALSFCLGGLLLCAGLGFIQYHHETSTTRTAVANQVQFLSGQLLHYFQHTVNPDDNVEIQHVLDLAVSDPFVVAIRYQTSAGDTFTTSAWPADTTSLAQWQLNDPQHDQARTLSLNRPIIISTQSASTSLALLLDTSALHRQILTNTFTQIRYHAMLLCILTIIGLVILRKWFTFPFRRIASLALSGAPASTFVNTAHELGGEFSLLAHAIGKMLHRVDEVSSQLRAREHAFQSLFHFAPVPILSIGRAGKITAANHRAAQLFNVYSDSSLLGVPFLDYIHPRDRALFRQSLDRLDLEIAAHCNLQMVFSDKTHDIALEMTAIRASDSNIAEVRISLLDVTDSRQLIETISEQRQLLDLVINHMSDAILLVDRNARIITANSRLCKLINTQARTLVDTPYEPAELWAPLELLDLDAFARRINIILNNPDQPANDQFNTRDGAFQFQVLPVCDETGKSVAQLWVIQEVSAQVRSQRLLDQQSSQLRALHQMGRELHQTSGVDQLLEKAVQQLYQIMDVEAVGIALRYRDPALRCRQLIHPGSNASPIPVSAEIAEVVRSQLMPQVLAKSGTCFWTDLNQHGKWTKPLQAAGFESLTATALFNQQQSQGIMWIARRGGKRIERHHLYLLEALAPMVSTAVESAQLHDQMVQLRLTDPITNLPSYEQFDLILTRLVNRPGVPWSILIVDIDHFHLVNEKLGHENGDKLLTRIAREIQAVCRTADQPCRYSEDQFAIVCAHTQPADAINLAQRIRFALAKLPETCPHFPNGITITASLGIASSPADDTDPDLLIHLALQRLTLAKKQGRNRAVSSNDDLQPIA